MRPLNCCRSMRRCWRRASRQSCRCWWCHATRSACRPMRRLPRYGSYIIDNMLCAEPLPSAECMGRASVDLQRILRQRRRDTMPCFNASQRARV